jgi:hypothetical protein
MVTLLPLRSGNLITIYRIGEGVFFMELID